MRTTALSALLCICSVFSYAQIFSEDFGNHISGSDVTTSNSSLSYVRIGSGGGEIKYTQSSLGDSSSIRMGGSSSGSLVGVGVLDQVLTPTRLASFRARLKSTDWTLGNLVISLGSGSRFSSNSGYTTSQLLAALQIDNGEVNIRDGSSWVSTDTLLENNRSYDFLLLMNGSANTESYAQETLPPGTCDLYLNGFLIADDFVIPNNQDLTAFRVYQTQGSMLFEIENLEIFNGLTPPSILVRDGFWSKNGVSDLNTGLGLVLEKDSLVISTNTNLAFLTTDQNSKLRVASASLNIENSLTNQGEVIFKPGASLLTGAGFSHTGSIRFEIERQDSLPGKMNFYSSPLPNQNLSSLFPGNSMMYSFDPSLITSSDPSLGWVSAQGNMELGKGYACSQDPGNTKKTISFTGNLSQNDFKVKLKNSGNQGVEDWNLVGNPFSSGLNLSQFLQDNSGCISSSAYVWNPSNGQGSYEVFNDQDGKMIALGQAFFVNHTGTDSLSFQLGQRSGNMDTFIKPGAYRQLAYLSFSTSQFKEWVKIQFDSNSSKTYSIQEDAAFLEGNNPLKVFTFPPHQKDQEMSLQVMPLDKGNKTLVPIGFEASTSLMVEIAIEDFSRLPSNWGLFLIDRKNGVRHNLRLSPYSTFLEPKDHSYKRLALEVIPNPIQSDPLIRNQGLTQGEDPSEIQVFDLQGRLIFKGYGSEKELELPSGLYLIKKGDQIIKSIINP